MKKRKIQKPKWHYELIRANQLGQYQIISKITGKILMKKLIPDFGKGLDKDIQK